MGSPFSSLSRSPPVPSSRNSAAGNERRNIRVVHRHLSLVTWNIEGLNHRYLSERTEAICDYLLAHQPSVVYLQEVVHTNWPQITRSLSEDYHCYCGVPLVHYFNAILLNKTSGIEPSTDAETALKFASSVMGRYLIRLPAKLNGLDVHFMTSHLESMDSEANVTERKSQLKQCFSIMEQLRLQSAISIFGGDLNTRDSEVQEVGKPDTIVDVWEACGSDKNCKRTWSTVAPFHRYDRVYMSASDILVPEKMRLVGGERLQSHHCFLSDHFGIWIDFQI